GRGRPGGQMNGTAPPLDTLRSAVTSPAAFRDCVAAPLAGGPGLFGPALAPHQRKDFAALDRAFLAVRNGQRPPVGRFFLERTKGPSQDADLAAMLLWLLAFAPRPVRAQVAAAAAEQADEIRKVAAAVVRLNPWLAELVDVQSRAIVTPNSGSRAAI